MKVFRFFLEEKKEGKKLVMIWTADYMVPSILYFQNHLFEAHLSSVDYKRL